MNDFLNQLAFGWYPYLALTVLIVGSILRFDADQYSWRSQSSQFLRRKQMMWGSNLLHMGVLMLFVGHFVGLLTPINVFDYAGISHGFKQLAALVVGASPASPRWSGRRCCCTGGCSSRASAAVPPSATSSCCS